jgi:KDO2-lipid IV(A) lauroyltransferase
VACVFYYIIPVRKKVARENLEFVFPEKSEPELSAIIRNSYINVLIVIAEFFYFRKWKPDELKSKLRFKNYNLFCDRLDQKKGLILMSAHFGNWELTAFGGSLICGKPFNVIVKEQTNRFVDRRITRIREAGGNNMIEMKHSAREILKVLRNNGIVAILGDQSAPADSKAKVKFFGKEITVFEGPALFALKLNVPVLVGIPFRQKDGSYLIDVKEIDTRRYSGYSEKNASSLMQEYFLILEECIKKEPCHWLWFHRRFKSYINY